uniref:C2H2-type domain-containing protein n=2 Tax=Gasterosteus aculeatus TaxID=69293 RepID=A0AAQ4NN97_GASAC|nr:zinc finger protein 516-like isoform X1 [Gasterosteus aculeatus aculeatus]XP_040045157.1 zinc finger protein 516-like isoform X1 [Gasterosteus aculeatus aculeatus]
METEEREDGSQNLTANTKAEAVDETSGHTCGVCGRSFPLLSSLSQHMRRHTREKPYKCPYCEHRAAQKGSLKAHIRSHKLGLFSRDLGDKGGAGARDPATPDPAESVGAPDKAQNVPMKAKKKGTKKKVKGKGAMELGDGGDDGSCTCSICGQAFPQVLLLKSHMKRHRNAQDHGCRICGRRFRQAWFLQSHMRIHRVKAQLSGGKSNEPPATVNGVPQDPAALANEVCLFELCAGCGNFFDDRKTLRAHEKLHKPTHGRTPTPQQGAGPSEPHAAKTRFLESLSLTRAGPRETPEDKSAGRRIPELDPICSYQAWQLATRGRLVEATEKCLGWEERLADAEVAFDTEKGEYVPLKQEKKRKPADTSSSNIKKIKGETGPERSPNGLAHTKGGDKKISQKDRILLNGLGHAFYEALQTKKVKDVALTPRRSNSNRSQDQEDKKTHFCEHCDFHTVDASLLKSHLQKQHQDFLGPHSKHSMTVDNSSQSGSKASRYMDYLRNRSLLLSQPYWNPYTCTPGPGSAASHVKAEKTNDTEVKGHTTDAGSLLNLSSLPVSEGEASVTHLKKTAGLVRHQCPYCSHTTNYPEVLWIHQRVAHRVDGSSSAAPKWAPCINSNKSLKAAGAQWRRTGPPPFLEGKDCPALPAPRTQRTQPPGSATSSSTSSKHSAPKTQPGAPKSKPQPKDSRSSDGTQSSGRTGPPAQKKSVEHNRAQKGGSKGSGARATSSSSIVHSKSSSGLQPADGPKHRSHRAPPVEANFPQEGLGFMLARNHGGASSDVSAERPHSQRQSRDSSSGPKGPDLWAAMNMWGHKAYMEPVRFAQVKSESTGDVPMDIDILSLLKNYSPHDLAAVYQHWGFVDPRIDPQAMLQLNGHFGKEVHSTTEASKQVNSRSTSSSGSLHKGT